MNSPSKIVVSSVTIETLFQFYWHALYDDILDNVLSIKIRRW